MGRNSHRHPNTNTRNNNNCQRNHKQDKKKNKGSRSPERRPSRRRPTNDQSKGKKEQFDDDKSFRLQVELDGKRSIRDMVGDGNCLFRSLSDQLFGDYGHMYHSVVREAVCDYMDGQKEYFQQFLVLDDDNNKNSSVDATSYEHYVQQMRQDGEWGGNMELIAASKLFQRNILVLQSNGAFLIDAPPDTATTTTTREDLIVSYHDNGHYNSVWIAGRKTMLIQPRELTKVNRTSTILKVMEESPLLAQDDGLPNTATKNIDDFTNKAKFSSAMTSGDKGTFTEEEESSIVTTNHNKKTKESLLKRNDLCTCGSALKYKKCCLARQKQQDRLQKFKQKHVQDYTAVAIHKHEDEDTVINIEGGFKVIKI
jgi:hypothetical protein